eukprot:5597510-Prymnesium_polylepis.1
MTTSASIHRSCGATRSASMKKGHFAQFSETYWLRLKSDARHAEPNPPLQSPRTHTPKLSLQLPQHIETTRVMKQSRC